VKGRKKFFPSTSMVFASYIIHIYRFRKDNPRSLVGVVEEVGAKGRKAFTNYDELWDILNSSKSIMQKRKSDLPVRREAKSKLR
jgi:hypothetical protein